MILYLLFGRGVIEREGMLLSDFDYSLPESLIAKYPTEQRDGSRLMVAHRASGLIQHRRFSDIIEYLRPGDCLALNDSKVIKARLRGFKSSGAAVELLLVRSQGEGVWEAMARPGKRLRPGDAVFFKRPPVGEGDAGDGGFLGAGEFSCSVLGQGAEQGTRRLAFSHEGNFMAWLDLLGEMPIPPYIGRRAEDIDDIRYQTVYSREAGSVAAPTAGLHFTEGLLREVAAAGVAVARVTLHVGPGTFLPVKAQNVEEHKMHFEEYSIGQEDADIINACKARGGRVICVGTTTARTLESAAFLPDGPERLEEKGNVGNSWPGGESAYRLKAGRGSTGIFIRPGYSFKLADGLITNFHLPKSTLLMLVSAFYGRERALAAYEEAVARGYRFFSYGDAMLMV